MARKTGQEMAEQLSDFLNSAMGFEVQEFARVVTHDHRALQQEAFKAIYSCLAEWSHAYETGNYDGRNESACKHANIMIKAILESSQQRRF